MEFNNKHIVLIFIIIIVGIFIYNYDVYVIAKNEPLCKPIYVTKREISPEIRAELNKIESNVLKETFNNINTYYEGFGNLPNQQESSFNLDIPNKSFSSFTIPSITNPEKLKVIDSVIKILSYIPTTYCENDIKQLVEYFGMIYETSLNLESFYKNVASSTKIKESPYNSKYSHLILFLIGKFDNDYSNCVNINNPVNNENCAMNELVNKINNPPIEGCPTVINPQNNVILPNETVKKYNQNTETNYLNNEINSLIEQKYLSSNEIIDYINNIKSYKNESNVQKENLILPNVPQKQQYNNQENNQVYTPQINNQVYTPQVYTPQVNVPQVNVPQVNVPQVNVPQVNVPQVNVPQVNNQYKNKPLNSNSSNCNGIKCSYKCDSSYMDAISYLDNELKPLESFGNIDNNYARFN